MQAPYVFNCTYSGLNQLTGDFPGVRTGLKHEITEMALMQLPPELLNLGVTLMDGPFFSMMPFPARGLHTLSHVRYTPHMHWQDQCGDDPYHRSPPTCATPGSSAWCATPAATCLGPGRGASRRLAV
ncbi:hypothetical protein LP419_26595 [Massilia sp. H-1]|nr:hypothetical protein LP419_26595 [Massilia sp. H-1]